MKFTVVKKDHPPEYSGTAGHWHCRGLLKFDSEDTANQVCAMLHATDFRLKTIKTVWSELTEDDGGCVAVGEYLAYDVTCSEMEALLIDAIKRFEIPETPTGTELKRLHDAYWRTLKRAKYLSTIRRAAFRYLSAALPGAVMIFMYENDAGFFQFRYRGLLFGVDLSHRDDNGSQAPVIYWSSDDEIYIGKDDDPKTVLDTYIKNNIRIPKGHPPTHV